MRSLEPNLDVALRTKRCRALSVMRSMHRSPQRTALGIMQDGCKIIGAPSVASFNDRATGGAPLRAGWANRGSSPPCGTRSPIHTCRTKDRARSTMTPRPTRSRPQPWLTSRRRVTTPNAVLSGGLSGHDANRPLCRLMIQSGHPRSRAVVPTVMSVWRQLQPTGHAERICPGYCNCIEER